MMDDIGCLVNLLASERLLNMCIGAIRAISMQPSKVGNTQRRHALGNSKEDVFLYVNRSWQQIIG